MAEALADAETVAGPGDGGGDGVDLNLELGRLERNDIGNAERLLARHGKDLLAVDRVGWHVWTGTHWVNEGADAIVKKRSHETAKSIMEEVGALQKDGAPEGVLKSDWDDYLDKHLKWSLASGNKPRLDAMVAEAAPYRACLPAALDADPMLLNLKNGTLVLEGSCEELREHRRDDRLAKIMDVSFDPDATCPKFLAFLERVQPDPEIRQFLQVWMGYCLTGNTSEQVLVFNYGPTGRNGKGVFTELFAKMMGPYAASVPVESLMNNDRKQGSEPTPDLVRLPGARMVRASEAEKGSVFGESLIKKLTGGDPIDVRRMAKEFFTFYPEFKLMISGNYRPQVRGNDKGIWDRLLLVPWDVHIPKPERDRHLDKKLWAERAGVLNWALDGLRIWLESGLSIPEAVRVATEDFREESDPVSRFIEACVKPMPSASVQASAMYAGYEKWCEVNSEKKFSQTAFGRALVERGLEKSKGRIVVYMGVSLDLGGLIDDGPSDPDPPPGDPYE